VVELPDGPVTLLPRRAPIGNSAPIRGRPLAVMPVGDVEHQGVLSVLSADQEPYPALVLPGEAPAIALLDLNEADAVNLGRALGQHEIFYWDGRRGRKVGCR